MDEVLDLEPPLGASHAGLGAGGGATGFGPPFLASPQVPMSMCECLPGTIDCTEALSLRLLG